MRKLVRNVLNKNEADKLILLNNRKRIDFNFPIVNRIIKDCINSSVTFSSPSYYKTETTGGEHDWHVDTGSHGHMKWCKYGISVLLSKPGQGGIFKYKNPSQEFTQEEHYLSAIVHTSDEVHKREEANEDRTVLLIFLEGINE